MLNLLAQAGDFGDWGSTTEIPDLTTTTNSLDPSAVTGLMAWLLPMMGILTVIGLVLYIYFALALYAIAKKTDTPNPWMAWVPIANIILTWQISKTPVWTLIVLFAAMFVTFIPIIGQLLAFGIIAIQIFWWWKICEKIGYPSWWSVMQLIPVVWLVMIGIMAWGQKGAFTASTK